MEKSILNTLEQSYTHTCVIHLFDDQLHFLHHNVSSVIGTFGESIIKASCVINDGKVRYYSGDKNDEDEKIALPGDIHINNFMNEIYRIHRIPEKDRNANDICILKAFSGALKIGYETFLLTYQMYIVGKRDHYLFVVPTEWEYNIQDDLIRVLFREAGLIDEADELCRLLFYSKLDAMVYNMQSKESDDPIYNIHKPITTTLLKRGERYLLFDLHTVTNNGELIIRCHSFNTVESKVKVVDAMKNDILIKEPVDAISSESYYSLDFVPAIRKNLVNFLIEKKMLLISVDTKENERSIMCLADDLIKEVLLRYTNKLKKENKSAYAASEPSYEFRIDQMSLQYIFLNWRNASYYKSIIQPEKLNSITMLDMHRIFFKNNEETIINLLNSTVMNEKESCFINNLIAFIKSDICYGNDMYDNYEMENWNKREYCKWIFQFFLLNSGKLSIEDHKEICVDDKVNFFSYTVHSLNEGVREKYQKSSEILLNVLPPLIINNPEKDYLTTSQPHYTIKSNPKYIVKTDINLFDSSVFSCVQLELNTNNKVKAILKNEIDSQMNSSMCSLPPLYRFFNIDFFNNDSNHGGLLITVTMLRIMEDRFKSVLTHFSKQDRRIAIKSSSSINHQGRIIRKRVDLEKKNNAQENENTMESTTIPAVYTLLPKDFKALNPIIKLELTKKIGEEVKLIEIKKQSYIKTFILIYLAVLKDNIGTFVYQTLGKTSDFLGKQIGYAINVDALLFDRVFKRSHSSMKELVTISGFATDDQDYKKNVRVLTEREEQVLPLLQQKANVKLPLKSFYIYARLYERYIQLSLNQVVIEGMLPEKNAKNIVIKSKIITVPYIFDLICDNLWNAIQTHDHYIALNAFCKKHNGECDLLQKFSLLEREKLQRELTCLTKKILLNQANDLTKKISIPLGESCDCKIHLEHRDIIKIAIQPALGRVVSIITGAATNFDIFGLYWIEHVFVSFNYIDSVFHHSQEIFLKYNLQRFIDINLAKKRLNIPHTVFSDSNGGVMKPLVNETFVIADSFIFGNVLQTSNETYGFSLSPSFVYWQEGITPDYYHEEYKRCEYNVVHTVVKSGDIIPESIGKSRVFYIKHFYTAENSTMTHYVALISKMLRRGSDEDFSNANADYSDLKVKQFILRDGWLHCNCNASPSDEQVYVPLYFSIKSLNYCSSIRMSLQVGTTLLPEKDELFLYVDLKERLTIMKTQY